MPTILPLQTGRALEARRLIHTVAHDLFHPEEPLEETLARYEQDWPLDDVLDFQEKYNHVGGAFLVMEDNGRIIATGALRHLETGIGEIKRMWLATEYQGQGLGCQMMTALLAEARKLGYTKVRLETAPAYQARAYAFYHKLGFQDIPRYGDDPDDIGMELDLSGTTGI